MNQTQQQIYETRKTIHLDHGCVEETGGCVIYFRIPMTMYFFGKDIDPITDEKTKIFLYRKEFDGRGYYFAKV